MPLRGRTKDEVIRRRLYIFPCNTKYMKLKAGERRDIVARNVKQFTSEVYQSRFRDISSLNKREERYYKVTN